MKGVVSQIIDVADHLIAFYSKKLSKHEDGWPFREQELLAIKTALAKRHQCLTERADVYTDNSACSNTSKCLQRWLAC